MHLHARTNFEKTLAAWIVEPKQQLVTLVPNIQPQIKIQARTRKHNQASFWATDMKSQSEIRWR